MTRHPAWRSALEEADWGRSGPDWHWRSQQRRSHSSPRFQNHSAHHWIL